MADVDIDIHLLKQFLESHPVESARILESRPPSEVAALLSGVEPEIAAAVVQRMAPGSAAAGVADTEIGSAANIVKRLPLDSTVLLLRRLPEPKRSAVMDSLPRRMADPIGRLLEYPEGTAGAVMDPNVFVVANDLTVRGALERLRRNPRTTIYYVYVTDREQRLVGVLTLRELMLANRDDPIVSAMHKSPLSMRATASHLELVKHIGWRKVHAIPVVDDADALLGVVRYETLRKLEGEFGGNEQSLGGLDLALSLSELYVKGLTGLIGGLLPRTPGSATERGDEPS